MTTTLTSPPSLGTLYTKAALATLPVVGGAIQRGGKELPDSTYSLAEQTIELDHLFAYERVCGFRTSDMLPATYLHVLAFPVTVALMTEPTFPFPLIGLVHVNNSITVHRPVTADEVVSFEVTSADLRPHPAGKQLDLVVTASVEGETVWSGRSTYLRRGKPSGESGEKAAKAAKSKRTENPAPAGPPAIVRVPDDIGRRYGAVSGDRNPIHLHSVSAKLFGFPSAIAHGMWLKARTLATLEGRLPDSYTVDVAFKTPVLLPSTVAIAATQATGGWDLDVRNVRNGRPHLSGTVRS